MHFNRGDVYWVLFPYEDTEDEKTRPAIVIDISDDSLEILTVKVTSQTHYEGEDFVVELMDWLKSGLDRRSFALAHKTRVLRTDRFGDYIGSLTEGDLLNVLEQVYNFSESDEGGDFGEAI